MRGIQGTFLVLLQVLVIGKRKALHGHEQLSEVAVHGHFAANELGKIRGSFCGMIDEPVE